MTWLNPPSVTRGVRSLHWIVGATVVLVAVSVLGGLALAASAQRPAFAAGDAPGMGVGGQILRVLIEHRVLPWRWTPRRHRARANVLAAESDVTDVALNIGTGSETVSAAS